MAGELEARLQRLEDLQEIGQIFVDYGRLLDLGDFAAFSRLFAIDGEILLGPYGRATGPAAIEALMTRAIGPIVGHSYHVISSPVIELDGDTATAEVMWTVVDRDDHGKPRLGGIGRHRDALVREDGRWRIKKRRGQVDIPSAIAPA